MTTGLPAMAPATGNSRGPEAAPSGFANVEAAPPLHEQIYAQLRHKLMTGQLRPGVPLVIRQLSQEMGTSPMPVRDALQRLATQGALVGKRTLCVPRLSSAELLEIRDIRLHLEDLALCRAMDRAGSESWRRVSDSFAAMQKAAQHNDVPGFLGANARFHLSIAQLADSPLLVSIIEPLWLRLGPAIELTDEERRQLSRTLPLHRRMMEAMMAGDRTVARAALREDILQSFASLPS